MPCNELLLHGGLLALPDQGLYSPRQTPAIPLLRRPASICKDKARVVEARGGGGSLHGVCVRGKRGGSGRSSSGGDGRVS
jgi:hypothetical protein